MENYSYPQGSSLVNLSIKLLQNVNSSNNFQYTDRINLIRGNPFTLYFRVVQPILSDIRYITNTAATMMVTFKNDDDSVTILNRVATMAFPADDRSIWYVNILPTDVVQYSSMTAQLIDGTGLSANIYNLNVDGNIATYDTDSRKTFL